MGGQAEEQPQRTWGDVRGLFQQGAANIKGPGPVPTPEDPRAVEADDLRWLISMARLGIQANAFVTPIAEAEARLAEIAETLGLEA